MQAAQNAVMTTYDYVSSTLLYNSTNSVSKKDNGDIVKRVSAFALPYLKLFSPVKFVVTAVTPIFKILKIAEDSVKETDAFMMVIKSGEIAIGWLAMFSTIFMYTPGLAIYLASYIVSSSIKIANQFLEGNIEKGIDKTFLLVSKTAATALLIINSPALAVFVVSFKICYSFYAAKAEASQGRLPECISKIALVMITKNAFFFGEPEESESSAA